MGLLDGEASSDRRAAVTVNRGSHKALGVLSSGGRGEV
jgi:hypothetical protein